MILQKVFLTFILLCFTRTESIMPQNTKGNIAMISPVRDKVVTSHILAEYHGVPTASRCLEWCTKKDSCLSFFYQPSERLCYINSVVFHASDSFWDTKIGTLYYLRIFLGVCGSLDYIYHPVTNICYKYYHHLRFNRTAVKVHCLEEGGQLISLDTMDKFNHIRDVLNTSLALKLPKRRVIVGAVKENGKWQWINGSPLSNTSAMWAPLYPGDTYLFRTLISGYGFYMITSHFNSNCRFVCERVPK